MAERDEGLIEYVDQPANPVSGIVRVLVLVLFTVALVGTAVIDRLRPVDRPMPTGAELQAMKAERAKATFSDGSLARLFADDLEQTSRMRTLLSAPYKLRLYHHLNEAGGDYVITGKEGWIFVRNRVIPPYRRSDVLLESWATQLAAVNRALTGLGMRVVFLPVPRRGVVESEFLPAGVPNRPEIDRDAASFLRDRGMEAVDLYPAFMNWEGQSLFYRADAHWNELGERVAAEEIMRQLGMLSDEGSRRLRLDPEAFETQGVLGDMNHDLFSLAGIRPVEGSDLLRGPDLPATTFLDRQGQRVRRHRNPKKMPQTALTGTSFSERRDLAQLLEHFGQIRVHDASASASGPIIPIKNFLAEHRENLPELLLVEVPIFTAFMRQKIGGDIIDLLQSLPADELQPFGPIDLTHPVGFGAFDKVRVAEKKNSFLVRTKAGAILSTWDNIFGLRVRGEVLKGTVDLRLLIDGFPVSATWNVGENETYFPLVAPRKGGSLFPVLCSSKSGSAEYKLTSVEFLTPVRFKEGVKLPELRRGVEDERWFVEFKLDAAEYPVLAGPEECAVVCRNWKSHSDRGFDGCTIEVLSGTSSRWITQGKICTGGWVMASLGDAGRDGPVTLRFSGPNEVGVPDFKARLAVMGSADSASPGDH